MLSTREKVVFGLILITGAVLLFANLGQYDIWGDEAMTFPKGDNFSEVLKYARFSGIGVHPPVYSLLQFSWVKLFAGWDTVRNRMLWAFFGWLNLILVYFLGKEAFERQVGLYGMLFCAVSPFFVQHSRMIRYYPVTTFFALLTFWAFLRFKRSGKRSDLIFFIISAVFSIYEDYLAVFVLFFMYLYLFFNFKVYKRQLMQWLLGAGIIFLLILPLFPFVFTQTAAGIEPYPEHISKVMDEAPRMAQKGIGPLGIILNGCLKIGFLSYIFALGETTYFWRWWITIPVFFTCAGLMLWALFKLKQPAGKNTMVIAYLLIATLIATVIVSEMFGVFGSRVFQFPAKVMFLAPLAYLLIVRGLTSIKKPILMIIFALVIFVGQVYGLNNYFSGEQFLNPKFLVPWRQIEADITAQAKPQDLILSDEEALDHTLKVDKVPLEFSGLVGAQEKVEQTLKERGPFTVFLVIRYRGDETIVVEGLEVRQELQQRYPLIGTLNYVPASAEAAPYWKRLLGRDPYPYLVDVYRFQVTGEPPETP